MPNIKSAEKRVKVTAVKKLNNQIVRSRMNTAVKKFNAAIAENDVALAEQLMPTTASLIDNAAVPHVIHKNAAAERKAVEKAALSEKLKAQRAEKAASKEAAKAAAKKK